ncbi:hypothetical protein AYI98_00825 [Shewanella algae]|uniref:hypothetical protein n=1 Tax=Shewanella algae TaxID=38313 RepID=UPI001C9046AD|nr:hypothetical protein [Shewanella algae]TVL53722.1 hypothetical protein AYI98_00825 [Shewanella algae]
MKNEIFGRIDENGNVIVLWAEDGEAVCRFEEDEMPIVYPVDSGLSCYYEHAEGIVISREDAEKIGIEIEE